MTTITAANYCVRCGTPDAMYPAYEDELRCYQCGHIEYVAPPEPTGIAGRAVLAVARYAGESPALANRTVTVRGRPYRPYERDATMRLVPVCPWCGEGMVLHGRGLSEWEGGPKDMSVSYYHDSQGHRIAIRDDGDSMGWW